MFDSQMKVLNNRLSVRMAEVSNTNGDPRLLKIEEIDDEQQDDFPKFLIGDNIRLK